jgi:phage tail tape-measure protein
VGVAIGVGSVVVETANAPEGAKLDTAVSGGTRLGGSLLGAQAGAEIGAVGGPWGALIGSILGSVGGAETVKALQNRPPMSEEDRIGMGVAFH